MDEQQRGQSGQRLQQPSARADAPKKAPMRSNPPAQPKNGGDANEAEMWHGTRSTPPSQLYKEGECAFDFRYSSEGYWGKGSYFAEDSSYSIQFSHKLKGFTDPGGGSTVHVLWRLTHTEAWFKSSRFVKTSRQTPDTVYPVRNVSSWIEYEVESML